jgi:hypothetical protein
VGKELILALLVAPAIALAACTTASGGFCAVSSPLRLSGKAVDALSDVEVRSLLAHNRKGQKLCGWRP